MTRSVDFRNSNVVRPLFDFVNNETPLKVVGIKMNDINT
jgi:hypothetical protein